MEFHNTIMAHTYSKLLYHVVFSTRKRADMLRTDLLPELARVAGGVVRKHEGKLLAINGPLNHLHVLMSLPPRETVSDVIRDLKAITSKWIHEKIPTFENFGWQEGYSVFSVSQSHQEKVQQYIGRQVEHHQSMTFDEELKTLLERHGFQLNE